MRNTPQERGCREAGSISGICKSMNTTSNARSRISLSQDFGRLHRHGGPRLRGSGALQQLCSNLLIYLVVFNQQNADSRGIMQRAVVIPFKWTRGPRVLQSRTGLQECHRAVTD